MLNLILPNTIKQIGSISLFFHQYMKYATVSRMLMPVIVDYSLRILFHSKRTTILNQPKISS